MFDPGMIHFHQNVKSRDLHLEVVITFQIPLLLTGFCRDFQ